MDRKAVQDLLVFSAVARERSFTRAAARLGVSQSALSRTVRELEARLGVRLLARTTRSVSPTEAGERLLKNVGPRFEEIDAELEAITELREKPAGTFRITTGDHAAETVLWPRLAEVSARPSRHQGRNFAGLRADRHRRATVRRRRALRRAGCQGHDRGADRADLRMAVVAAPAYLRDRSLPHVPQDLTQHICINLRLPTLGGLYAWEFARRGRELKVRVEGQLVFNGVFQVLNAALAGFGLAYVPEDLVQSHLADGRLERVLEQWCPYWTGYHLYYPSRRQSSAAFALLVDALRYRG